jgi:hypothetical protein
MMFAITIAPTTSEMPLMKTRSAKAPAEIPRQTFCTASPVTKETGSGWSCSEDGARLVHRGLDRGHAALRLHVDRDVAVAAERLAQALTGHVDDVVLALAQDRALLHEEPDHLERRRLDEDHLADGVDAREELVAHLRADDRDVALVLVLGLGEEASELDVEVLELGHVRGRARDLDVGDAVALVVHRPRRSGLEADHRGRLREAGEVLGVPLLDALPLQRREELLA